MRTPGIVTMDRDLKETFIIATDNALMPVGFKRTKTSLEWKRKSGQFDVQWVHLNFGLGVINPSIGVVYGDLTKLLPKESGSVDCVSQMLTAITGEFFSDKTNPLKLAEIILTTGLQKLEMLLDRPSVISTLKTEDASSWPVFSLSHRIRLLPLLLYAEGNAEEAYRYAHKFENQCLSRDQLIPKYDVFKKHLLECSRA